jgi:hypothetical protein
MKIYFCNRNQFNVYNIITIVPIQVQSLFWFNHCSVFLIYINDICNVSKTLELILSADDTNVFYSHENFEYLVDTLNDEIDKLSEWLKVNKLTLNLVKTKYVLFKPRLLNLQRQNMTTESTFLGVILDENLSGKSHYSHISSKIDKSIGIITSFYLLKSSLKILYYALVYAIFNIIVILFGLQPTHQILIALLFCRNG